MRCLLRHGRVLSIPVLLAALPASAQEKPGLPVAGGVVSSREWVVRRSPEKEEEFIGDVRYRTGQSQLKADWALYRHASQAWEIRGRVRIEHALESRDILHAEGEKAFFNQKTRQGELRGPSGASFRREPADGAPDYGKASVLRWEGRERADLTGGVHLWGPRLEAWSDKAGYEAAAGRLTLEGGRPVLLKLEGFEDSGSWVGAVKADKAQASTLEKRLEAAGRAVGWLRLTLPGESGP